MNDMSASAIPDLNTMKTLEVKVSNTFEKAGFEHIDPAIMQPADVYLQQIGEAIRGRTYVFSDINGDELCLRPDLTVPAARVYIERSEDQTAEKARYYYSGPTFRYPYDEPASSEEEGQQQPSATTPAHGNSREFRQAGIEIFGKEEKEKAEVEVLKLTLDALKEVGTTDFNIRMGDLGLFFALLDAIDMPDRWRKRLAENFWRHEDFQNILTQLSEPHNLEYENELRSLLKKITNESKKDAEQHVGDYLASKAIPLIGARTLEEITNQLIAKAADLTSEPLEPEKIDIIKKYLEISAPPKAVGARLQDLAETAGLDLSKALDRYQKRIELLSSADIDLCNAEFTAEFGRKFEYYTGFVFQIEKHNMGPEGHIAGGGRYDHLLHSLGLPKNIPAIGAAINLDRLAALIDGDVL
ncbi:MAG: ATP phosphoribosyltransferase regulatory subunit [Rhizobiales bacterium]|nr:ATP phosphoribosyltransferase regulatory subunit [Hyphomicrobiales bacterium]